MPVTTRQALRLQGLPSPEIPAEAPKPRTPRKPTTKGQEPERVQPLPRSTIPLGSSRRPTELATPHRSPSPLTSLASSSHSGSQALSSHSSLSSEATIYDTSPNAVPGHPTLQRMFQKPWLLHPNWEFRLDLAGEALHLYRPNSPGPGPDTSGDQWVDVGRMRERHPAEAQGASGPSRGTRSPSPLPTIVRVSRDPGKDKVVRRP
ncbi:hypothetical protein C8F01DRAFT_1191147 [Mycena amicta]|nr:hypothetical protein C8F01DRAFT_1191147 [Mycena amicta]